MSEFAAKIAEAIALGRVNAEALMTDSLSLVRPTGEFVRDEEGNTVPEMVPVWSGPGKVQIGRAHV